MNTRKWWGVLCLAIIFALPGVQAYADHDRGDRYESKDDKSKKSSKSDKSKKSKKSKKSDKSDKSKKSKKSKKSRKGGDTPELELDSVKYQADENRLRIKGEFDELDGPTTLVVTDAALGTELAVVELVKEKFNFKVPLATDAPVPCEVLVSADGLSDQKRVRKAPDNCGKFTKTITGLVTDLPIPNATVSVTIDGVTYTTTADALGAYALEIATASVGDLVKVEASGISPATGAPIEFVNFAGSFERVLSDEPQNVTNVTTASFVLAVEANGGVEPTTLEELQAAETAVDATELFQLAAVIKLLVDDPSYALPAGFDSVLDFASDETAVQDFVATAEPADIEASLAEILSDSDLVVGFTEDDVPARYFAIPTANPGFLAREGSILEFDKTDNTGATLTLTGSEGLPVIQGFTWSIEGGRLVIVYDAPLTEFAGFSDLGDTSATPGQRTVLEAEFSARGEPVFISGVVSTIEAAYTRVNDGALVDVVAAENRRQIDFDPVELFATNPGVFVQLDPIIEIENSTDNLRPDNKITPIPFGSDCAASDGSVCVEGAWGGLYVYDPGINRFFDNFDFPRSLFGEVMSFTGSAAGSVTGVISGETASWSIVDDRLVIDYGDGTTETITLVDNNGIEYGAFVEVDTAVERFATYTVFVKANESFSFTEEYLVNSAPGLYWNGDINTWLPASLDDNGERIPNARFGWQFDSADPRVGLNLFYREQDCPGSEGGDPEIVRQSRPFGWEVETDRLLIERFIGEDIQRYWYPIAAIVDEGERQFYVMELEFRFGGYFFPARLNIEREIADDLVPDCDLAF